MSLKGTLGDLSVPDLLQIPLIGRLTGALGFANGDREAVVYYHSGAIVHAESGELQGEHVVYDLLEWAEGKFSFEKGRQCAAATIKKDVQHLLLEGLRRLDERARAEAERQQQWKAQLGSEAELATALSEALVNAGTAVAAAAVLDRDGRVLASWPGPVLPESPSYQALRTCVRMWKAAETGCDQLYWGTEATWVAGRSLGAFSLLAAVAKERTGLGQFHFGFKKAVDLLLLRLQIANPA
ncbi:MAG: DUF4388 domain-containing protein [Candidatus Eisenbacteria bacterium]|jgi:hypothetical protein|nr:DUF4388 domain-containing protein [Candidatus Eisenbacteria bacterium]